MPEQENLEQPRKAKWRILWYFEYKQTYPTVVAVIHHPTLESPTVYHRRGIMTQGEPQLLTYAKEFYPVLQEQVDILNGVHKPEE